MEPCHYCSDTGLSVYSSADRIRSICNVCETGKRLQRFLALVALLPPEAYEEVVGVVKKYNIGDLGRHLEV